MLDETMTYSCAVFETPETHLVDAQRAKLDRICTKLDLGPGDHVVEIGTGWGGFALHAATHYGCRVTTTTLSRSQHELALRRVAEAGLADRVTVLGSDYRDLEGTYDKLVSIEMIEAVDWRLHDTFFATCARLLAPDGLMLLQAIVIADRSYERAKHHDDFIRRMVFPGGCLPSVTAIGRLADPGHRPAGARPRGHRPALRRHPPGVATRTSRSTGRTWRPPGSTSASTGCGPSTSATARRPSSSGTSVTSRWSSPGRGTGHRSRCVPGDDRAGRSDPDARPGGADRAGRGRRAAGRALHDRLPLRAHRTACRPSRSTAAGRSTRPTWTPWGPPPPGHPGSPGVARPGGRTPGGPAAGRRRGGGLRHLRRGPGVVGHPGGPPPRPAGPGPARHRPAVGGR